MEPQAVPEVDVDELAKRRAGGAPVLDVRQPHEYEEFHIPGAVLIPLADLPDRVADVPAGRPLYVVCAGGGRSRRAAGFLRANGVDAVNVAGGSRAWLDAGEPIATGPDAG
jgi:rhodanese-related sulfurtransferase